MNINKLFGLVIMLVLIIANISSVGLSESFEYAEYFSEFDLKPLVQLLS